MGGEGAHALVMGVGGVFVSIKGVLKMLNSVGVLKCHI